MTLIEKIEHMVNSELSKLDMVPEYGGNGLSHDKKVQEGFDIGKAYICGIILNMIKEEQK